MSKYVKDLLQPVGALTQERSFCDIWPHIYHLLLVCFADVCNLVVLSLLGIEITIEMPIFKLIIGQRNVNQIFYTRELFQRICPIQHLQLISCRLLPLECRRRRVLILKLLEGLLLCSQRLEDGLAARLASGLAFFCLLRPFVILSGFVFI